MSGMHTPGPWAWSKDYQTIDGRSTWSLIGADGYGILSCDGEENSPQGINGEANACLVAAAPELLEALIAILPFVATEVLEHCDGNKCREPWCAGCMGEEAAIAAVEKSQRIYQEARSVIAAATGEQP